MAIYLFLLCGNWKTELIEAPFWKWVSLVASNDRVTLKQQAPSSGCTLVDVGLSKNVVIDQVLEPGTRVTVAMGTDRNFDDQPRQVVSSSMPREELGMYLGYKVRYAANISSVLNCYPYTGGYDHLIGTSEHGIFVKSSELKIPSFSHLLIAFGGLAGLEECIEEDKNLKVLEICYENPLSLSLSPYDILVSLRGKIRMRYLIHT